MSAPPVLPALAWAHPLVRDWFVQRFGTPTEPQEQGWPHILAGHTTLQPWRDAAQLVGVFVGMLAATTGIPLLKWQRRRNEGLSRWCEAELAAGHEGALARASAAGVAMAFAIGVASCAAWIALGTLPLRAFVEHESLRLSHGWTLAQPLWLGFGLAQLLNAFIQRKLTRAAVFGAAMVGAWLTLVMGTP